MKKIEVICLFLVLALLVGLSIPAEAGKTMTAMIRAGYPEVWQKFFDEFEKQTGIKVEAELVPRKFSDFVDQITVKMATGYTGLDVIWCDEILTKEFQASGLLEPLTGVVPEDYLQDVPPEIDRAVPFYEGIRYSVYGDWTLELWCYRKDWFDELGLTPPETWNELVEVGKKLTKDIDGDGRIDRYGISLQASVEQAPCDMNIWMGQAGGDFLDWESESSRVAVEFYRDLAEKYKIVPPSYLTDGWNENLYNYMGDVQAITYAWDGFYSILVDNKEWWSPEKAEVMLPPKGPKDNSTIGGGWMWIIPKASKKKDLAKQFIEFAISKDARLMLAPALPTPIRLSLATDPAFVKMSPVLKFRPMYSKILVRPRSIVPKYNSIRERVTAILQRYLMGKISLDECMKQGAEAIKEIRGG